MKISLYTLILPRIELSFLEEWITHNLSLGVDEIFIYNNGCKSMSTEMPSRKLNETELEYKWTKKPDVNYLDHLSDAQIEDGLSKIENKFKDKVKIISWVYKKDHDDKYPKSQVTGYKHCVENNPSDYWLFCDPDEFFVLQKHKTFQDLIKDAEMKDVGAFWFGSEIYEPRKVGLSIGELKTTGKIKKSKGNWRYTGCDTKCLVKSPILWANKWDSIIHKNRSQAGPQRHIDIDIAYFKHYTTEFSQELENEESEYIPPEPINTEVIIEDAPIEKVTNIISSTASDVDVDTLVCINSCEKDFHHLSLFKESELYKKMQESENVGILEVYRGHDKTDFEKGKILLPGDERYDKLHIKTYDMIKWCIANLKFNSLVKLDCNFLTYTHVGERTKKRICGVDKVEKLIYKRHRKSYDGTNGRMFFLKDFRAWAEQKQIITLLEEPTWLENELWYYCGKAYKVRYDFAKFIATSERCKRIVGEHDIKNASGYHPFAVEDVMIGRMHEAFLESEE